MAFKYRKGERQPMRWPLDGSSASIVVGQAITMSGATAGYFKEVDGSGETVMGIAMENVTVAAGASDGDHTVLVDVSEASVYEVPPDTGSVAVTIVSDTCDVGADGLTINIDASATDDIVVIGVDLNTNTAFVQLRKILAGVA